LILINDDEVICGRTGFSQIRLPTALKSTLLNDTRGKGDHPRLDERQRFKVGLVDFSREPIDRLFHRLLQIGIGKVRVNDAIPGT